MKRVVVVILLLAISFSLFSTTIKKENFGYEYEEYKKEEFPIWSQELRRAETIFFGSFVITLPLSTLCVSLIAKNANTNQKALYSALGAVGSSLIFAGLDFVFGRIGW